MDANEICDNIITEIKRSNLNYTLEETPFSVRLSMRKSFLKGKNGQVICSPPKSKVTESLSDLKVKNENLEAKLELLEKERDSWEAALGELSDKLEKSKVDTADFLREKHELHKAKEIGDKNLDKSKTEVGILKTNVKNLTFEKDKLEAELKTANKRVKISEKEVFSLESKNENLSDNLKRTKSEVNILNKDKKKITKEKESLQKKFENVSASFKLSKPKQPSSPNVNNNSLNITSFLSPSPSFQSKDFPTSSINISQECITNTSLPPPGCFQTPVLSSTLPQQKTSCSSIKLEDSKPDQILELNKTNFQNPFINFLEDFRAENTICPKYQQFASEMMKNNHNMFHFELQDIQKFNFRLSEFIDSHYEQLREDFADLIKIFIFKLGLGECKHGLHHHLHRGK